MKSTKKAVSTTPPIHPVPQTRTLKLGMGLTSARKLLKEMEKVYQDSWNYGAGKYDEGRRTRDLLSKLINTQKLMISTLQGRKNVKPAGKQLSK